MTTPEPEPEPSRCRSQHKCDSAETVYDDDGKRIGTVGAVIPEGQALCRWCSNHISYALGSLANDVRDLSLLLVPSSAPQYSDPDMPRTPCKPASKLPLRTDVLALQQLIDFEVTTWAALTNPAWNVRAARKWRQQRRVTAAVTILHTNASIFLALPYTLTRARSLSENRSDTHDPDTTTRLTTDIWCRRDGVIAGIRLLDLHLRAERFAGKHPGESIAAPCPECSMPALLRSAGPDRTITCQSCWTSYPDAEFENFLDAALAEHGMAEFSPLNGPRYTGTPWVDIHPWEKIPYEQAERDAWNEQHGRIEKAMARREREREDEAA